MEVAGAAALVNDKMNGCASLTNPPAPLSPTLYSENESHVVGASTA